MTFLESNNVRTVARPYVDLGESKNLTQLEFYSDASLNKDLGIGARFEWE